MSFKTMLATKKIYIYSVDVEVVFDLGIPRKRSMVTPYNIPASSDIEAAKAAVAREKARRHVVPVIGDPRVVSVRKIDFREGW